MLSCAVYGCDNNTLTNNDPDVTYYYFPKEPDIAEQWIQATGWERQHIDLANARVCSIHFEDHSYTTEYKMIDYIPCYTKVLKYDAVPTLYLPGTTHIIIKHALDVNQATENQTDIKQMIVYVPTESPSYEVHTADGRNFIQLQGPFKIEPQPENEDNGKYSFIQTEEQLSELTNSNDELKKEVDALTLTVEELKNSLSKKHAEWKEKHDRYKSLKKQYLKARQKVLISRHQKTILPKIFSNSQIKILSGKKKIYWSNDDMAVGYTIRHLSNKRCYSYLTKHLKIPLPAVSSIKRWINLKYKSSDKHKKLKIASDESYIKNE